MKYLILLIFFSFPSFARPHLDLEMTSKEYLHHLSQRPRYKSLDSEDVQIEKYLSLGKRNLMWVDFINAHRTSENRISLSSPATQVGSPVTNPRTYNFRSIKEKWDIILALMPKSLKRVVVEGAPFTTETGVTDREFIEWLFQLDAAYQIAARYKMMLPYKEEMKAGIHQDVRGYLNLLQEDHLDDKLENWNFQSEKTKGRLSKNLIGTCMNSGALRNVCAGELVSAISDNKVLDFKNRHLQNGKAVYDNFFDLEGSRSDGVWSESSLTFPFRNPGRPAILEFLKTNIEEEWQWNDWKLILNFVDTDDAYTTHIVFEEGATPHVEIAPGSTITMDANTPLSEYDVQWTIRHEYGHVIGFPDCYHEFYDEELEAFVSYQLDVTNLMCSRRGKLQEKHYLELRKHYSK